MKNITFQPGIIQRANVGILDAQEQSLLKIFTQTYWKATRIEKVQSSGSLYKVALLKPSPEISKAFNIVREMAVVFSPYEKLEPRTLDAIDLLQIPDLRIEEICFFLVSRDENVELSLSEMIKSNQESRIIVPFSYIELEDISPNEKDNYVLSKMRKLFYSRDLFGIQDPLKKELFFFGRQTIISDLVNKHLCNENSGLFGLRKTGKTSILYGVERALDRKKSISLFIDCQTLHNKEWNMALFYIISQLQKELRFSKSGKVHSMEDYQNESFAAEYFEDDLILLHSYGKKKILLIFDEIENITFDTSITEFWKTGEAFIKFWQVIRSTYQRNQNGDFSYLITGTNPRCIETPSIKNVDNPIFSQIRPYYIPPFDYKQTKEMIDKLGGYMGLNFMEEVCTHLEEDFGGHPLLMRQMCSFIHKKVGFQRPYTIVKADYELYKEAFYKEDTGFPQYAKMVLDVLSNWYNDEYQMLLWLAQKDIETFNGLAHLSPLYISHLINYGIIIEHNGSYSFKIEALADYLLSTQHYTKLHLNNNEKQQEICERRNKMEPMLRRLVRNQLRASFGEDEAKKIVIKEIYGMKECDKYRNMEYSVFFDSSKHPIYLNTLFEIMRKNWNVFHNVFGCDIAEFSAKATLINKYRKTDAHATEMSDSDFQLFRGAMGWIENILSDNS